MSEQEQTAMQGVDLAQAYLELTQALRDAKAENARLKSAGQSKVGVKLSEKGAISAYGLGRWPVTLYKSQWERLLEPDVIERIKALFSEAKDKAD